MNDGYRYRISFLAGSIFTCLIVWMCKRGCNVYSDPMDEAEANCPRCCDSGSIDSSKLVPRREVKPSGRKHFVED